MPGLGVEPRRAGGPRDFKAAGKGRRADERDQIGPDDMHDERPGQERLHEPAGVEQRRGVRVVGRSGVGEARGERRVV